MRSVVRLTRPKGCWWSCQIRKWGVVVRLSLTDVTNYLALSVTNTPDNDLSDSDNSNSNIIEDDEGVNKLEPRGVPDPYYPIYLPIDQAFKTKYVFHHKRGKTFQESVYMFLEHPVGWFCFIYHIAV
ncbi:hypothetical protein RUM43_012544 [Polyplax serrata]|uniref:Uncharacterized protein n=1 Tax=Polyplax serrata TaxID=468196 RepID=A0AAN8NRU2_POLSC